MKAPATKIMPCGHTMQCVISGHEDCQYHCSHNLRKAQAVYTQAVQVETKCVECGKVCYGISYCGCHGWD